MKRITLTGLMLIAFLIGMVVGMSHGCCQHTTVLIVVEEEQPVYSGRF